MKDFRRIALSLILIAAYTNPVNAAPVTLTPPDTLVFDGVNVDQGIFTLQSATTIDIFQSIATGTAVESDLISAPVVIDPAVIGSGTEHFLFDAPDTYLPLNIFTYSFEIVSPAPAPNTFGTATGITFSAIPDFTISLPTTTGSLATGLAIGFEYIDINGQRIFASRLFDRISQTPDPAAVLNFDIFADSSLFLIFDSPLDAPFNFQSHGGVRGFTPPPSAVPVPSAFWLMSSALMFTFAAGRRKKN
jgi:hypothetical protein